MKLMPNPIDYSVQHLLGPVILSFTLGESPSARRRLTQDFIQGNILWYDVISPDVAEFDSSWEINWSIVRVLGKAAVAYGQGEVTATALQVRIPEAVTNLLAPGACQLIIQIKNGSFSKEILHQPFKILRRGIQ